MEPKNYYKAKLAAKKLVKCYQLASPQVRQYMESEILFVLDKLKPEDKVLDLGCGFGRVIPDLAKKAALVVGVDNSNSSLLLAKSGLQSISNCLLVQASAQYLSFKPGSFDVTICIQNGISAFHIDPRELLKESLRVTKSGGIILFTSYSTKFWSHRLEWFERQADAGLLGEIDKDKTRNGEIVCKDGFKATTVSPEQFLALTSGLNADITIKEIDESSIFCQMIPY